MAGGVYLGSNQKDDIKQFKNRRQPRMIDLG